MTRQPSKRSGRILARLSLTISILALIAIGAIYYFDQARMGMARHLVYLNYKWEEAYPLGAIKLIALVAMALMAIYILYKSRGEEKRTYSLIVGVMDLVSLIYILWRGLDPSRVYLSISLVLIINFIQANIFYLIVKKG